MVIFRIALKLYIFLLIIAGCADNSKTDQSQSINAGITAPGTSDFLVGAGIFDITGPAAEVGMMGYAQLSQKTAGILQRIYARAFVFAEKNNPDKRMVFVSADLGQLFQSIHQGVLKQLKAKFGDLYNEKNVMISATHSHSGPGGYSHDLLYNLTTLGFNEQNYNVIVNGIVGAISRAHANLAPSTISLAIGEVANASFNRSPDSYNLNPAEERARYNSNVDRRMVQLRMDNNQGPFAILNWFAVHGTSLDNKNLLISGDNKGYAASQLERINNSDYGNKAFVAAFAQEASGDISPNELGTMGKHGLDGIIKLSQDGNKQLETALSLFKDVNAQDITGGLDYRQIYVNMADIKIMPRFTAGDGEQNTCPSAIGISMLAGAADGPGFGEQGISCNKLSGLFGNIFSPLLPFSCNTRNDNCQKEKPIVLPTAGVSPPMIPQILPIQIFRLGQLAIVALPFEITTMAGRRIKELVKKELEPVQVNQVVIAGLSNGYAGYITTREEYKAQLYEGASNQFGPYTLNAILQILTELSSLMINNQQGPSGPSPLDLSTRQITLQTPVLLDAMPVLESLKGKGFGSLKTHVKSHYAPLETVTVEFWGAHPKNNLLTGDSFLSVEKLNQGRWGTILKDRDIETSMEWRRFGVASSIITISWQISKGTQGVFRIRHKGFKKTLLQKLESYEGVSSQFTVGP